MGFGTSIAGSLIIITFLVIGVNIFVALTDITQTSAELLNKENEDASMELRGKTSETSNSTGTNITTLTTSLENRGDQNLDIQKIDLYRDGVRKNRSNVQKDIVVSASNPGLWDPGEILNATIEEERSLLQDTVKITITNNKGGQVTTVIEVE